MNVYQRVLARRAHLVGFTHRDKRNVSTHGRVPEKKFAEMCHELQTSEDDSLVEAIAHCLSCPSCAEIMRLRHHYNTHVKREEEARRGAKSLGLTLEELREINHRDASFTVVMAQPNVRTKDSPNDADYCDNPGKPYFVALSHSNVESDTLRATDEYHLGIMLGTLARRLNFLVDVHVPHSIPADIERPEWLGQYELLPLTEIDEVLFNNGRSFGMNKDMDKRKTSQNCRETLLMAARRKEEAQCKEAA